ncbi:MAG TPA: long-chain fatty acid--CoA ligase [Verrucomicrobiae bacterium]|nr:long-chain fatty acid--CoA ligase [Verrucomicrobiae bacterium]
MTEPTVIARFDAVAAAQPRRVAVLWGKERITNADIAAQINVYGAALQADHAIGKGDRVGILLKNSPEFIYVLYAVLKLGATVVPINTFLKAPEIQHILDDCQLRCLVTSPDFDEVTGKLERVTVVPLESLALKSAGPRLGVGATDRVGPRSGAAWTRPFDFARDRLRVSLPTQPERVPTNNLTDAPRRLPTWPAISPDDLAVIIYTSGTTGKPKGALLTHGNIAANVGSCIKALEETTDDRLTLLLPMFHSFMLTVGIFTPLSMGAGIVLIKSIHPLKAAMREIIMNRATIFVGIPQIFQALAEAKIPFWLHWVLKLRMAVSGAAPLPRETLDAFERKMRFPLLEGYGLSEASPVVSFNPWKGVRKAGSVGLPLPDVEVKVFDDHDRELPPGQVGEIVVRGPNVMRGYYNHPEETASTLRSGWLHTGDMGKKDEDGYIYIVDRRKEMLLVRGLNVYPREIEEVLHQFPSVREAAVVAKADEKRGEVPMAFVSPVEGATLDPNEILKFCRDRLADYKMPREVRIMDALPRTATGKIAKLELKKRV